jgi:hypothetical protein
MGIAASTAKRVVKNTSPEINRRIHEETESRLADTIAKGDNAIRQRLKALDEEWDIERCLETGASSLILLGTILGTTRNKKWLLLVGGVSGFLLQHALQGWCPPLPIFRRLGVRTADEINLERNALKESLQK